MFEKTIDRDLEAFISSVNAYHSPSDEPQQTLIKLGEGFNLADLISRLRRDVSRKHLVGKRKGKSFGRAIELSDGRIRLASSKKAWWCRLASAKAEEWEPWEYVWLELAEHEVVDV